MLTIQHQEEALSAAWITAIASQAGQNTSFRSFDYGVDGTFHQVGQFAARRRETGISLDYQAKASINCRRLQNQTHLSYSLEGKTYNDSLARNYVNAGGRCQGPLLLLLLCLPEDRSQWASLSPSELILRESCYYDFVRQGQPTTQDKITIRIPLNQRFTPDRLLHFLDQIEQELPPWL